MMGIRLWVLALLFSMSPSVQAMLISGEVYPHFFEVESYIDESATLSVEEVISKDQWEVGQNHFAYGYSLANFWFKVNITNISDNLLSPLIWITEDFFHEAVFYEMRNGQWVVYRSGLEIPVNQRDVLSTYPHLPLNLKPHEEREIYIKLNGEFGNFGALMLGSEKGFYTQVFTKTIIFSIIIVALVMLSLFYLVLHLYLKEKSFIFYSFYSLSYSIWVALYNGIIPMFFNEGLHAFLHIFMPISFIFLIWFSQSIMDTASNNPYFHKLLNIFVGLYLVAIIVFLFDTRGGLIIHNLVVIITMSVLITLSILSLVRKDKIVRLCALGLFTYFVGLLLLTFLNLGYLPYNSLTRNAPFPGSVIEIAFFAYILALKVFQMQDKKEQSIRTLATVQKDANVRLENLVIDRTKQLQLSIDKQYKIIKQYSGFISLITHELRNPLGVIKSQVALLRKESEKGINNCKNRLKTVSVTVQRMEILFEDWLISDQLESDLFSLNIQTLDLSEWIYSLQNVIEQTYSTHRFKFENQIAKIDADAVLLKLALYNLVDNAVKYSPQNSLIRIKVQLEVDVIKISVEDEGVGVQIEDRERIFERFIRGKSDSKIQGSGLGLFLVRNVMDLHNGQVVLDDQYEKGSRFILIFNRV
jgi:signal transduction histidine kinase